MDFEPPDWMLDICGRSADDVYISALSYILHYDGSSWSVVRENKTQDDEYQYAGSAWCTTNDIFFLLAGGEILRYNGTWTVEDFYPSFDVWEWWGASGTSTDTFVIGHTASSYVILNHDGTSWSEISRELPFSPSFNIWGTSTNDLFVTGYAYDIAHYDGTTWSEMSIESGGLMGEIPLIHSLWGSSSNDVFAVGIYDLILHYDGSSSPTTTTTIGPSTTTSSLSTSTTTAQSATTTTALASSGTVTLKNHWTTGEAFDFFTGSVGTLGDSSDFEYDMEFVGTPDSPALRATGEEGGIVDMGRDTLDNLVSLPSSDFNFQVDAEKGHSYWIKTPEGSYYKFYVTAIDTTPDTKGNASSVTFEYEAEIATTTTISVVSSPIIDHMMTKDPTVGEEGELPDETSTFTTEDETANCWIMYRNATVGDEVCWDWYQPGGSLYYQTSRNLAYIDGYSYSGLKIKDYPLETMPGDWHVTVYYKGTEVFTEYFTIVDPYATTTTTALSTTTTISCPAEYILGYDSRDAAILRSFRDEVLLCRGDTGRRLVTMYYTHAAEIADIIMQHQSIREQALTVLGDVRPALEDMLRGRNVRVSPKGLRGLVALCDSLSVQGSPVLKKAIEEFRKTLVDRQILGTQYLNQ
jgi:hypothetical protein